MMNLETQPEKVFIRSNPKPIETNMNFPDRILNSYNQWSTFLVKDPKKQIVFENFRKLNRDLTKAFNR